MTRLAGACIAIAVLLLAQPAAGALRGAPEVPKVECDPAAASCGKAAPEAAEEDHAHEWMLVSAALQAYDYAGALIAIDALGAKEPFNPDVAFMRGYALHRQHRDAEAIKAFDQAISLNPEHSMAFAQRGLSRAALGDTAQALADEDKALAIVPENPTAMAYKGLILIASGKDGEGLTLLGDAVDLAPDFVWILLVRATALADLKQLDLALADADKAVADAPEDPSVYAVRGRIRLEKRDHAGALADAEKGLALGGQDPYLTALRSRARAASGDPEGAIADLALLGRQHPGADAAMKAEIPSLFGDGPGDPLPRLLLALQKIEHGDARGARAIAEQVLLTTPWARPAVLMVRAYASYSLGDTAAATADLDELEAAVGRTAESRYLRAKVQWAGGERGPAMENIDAALASAPDDPIYLETRATFRYEAGDLAGALPDFAKLAASDDYGEWAQQMQFLSLYYLERDREAGERALPYLRAKKPTDDSFLRAVADTVWRLQAGDTWRLADDLLAMAAVPSQGRDFDLFLRSRSAMHAGRKDEAAALLGRIGAHDLLLTAMSDAAYAPLWQDPALGKLFDMKAMYRRSFEAAWQAHREHPEDLLAATYALGALADLGCGDAAAAAARRLVPSLSRYAGQEQYGAGVFETIAANDLRRGDAAAAVATWRDGIARLGADNPYALPLMLNAGFVLAEQKKFDEALVQVSRVETISPSYDYGIVTAHYIRALAYDGLGRAKERDAALDYAARHAQANVMAAVLAVGLLRSYDEAAALLAGNLGDHVRGQRLLGELHVTAGRPKDGIETREQALLDRLRADPRIKAALRPVGRILTLPDNDTCPLTDEELAARPFDYPFEKTPMTGDVEPAAPSH